MSDKELIQKLADLTPIAYDRVRVATAKGLDIRPATLDKMVKELRKQAQGGDSMPYDEVESYPYAISPCELLDEIAATIRRFIVCQNETVIAATLWIAMTWFIDVIDIAPLAIISAPEKRCGKSQLLFLLRRLVYRPIVASNITPAALFRSIDLWHPTLLIDEADTFMRDNEELRGLINCGHTRDSAYIIRVVGEEHIPKTFFVWRAKALAGIGRLPATMMDRAITLELRRKKPDELTERLRHAESGLFQELAAKLARFADDYSDDIRATKPSLPDCLNDRAQDNWEPLFAIAMTAGEKWIRLAQAAAIVISGDEGQSPSIGIELLKDIYDVIEVTQADRISSVNLINALCADVEKPWATFNRGMPISPRQVANQLKAFGIHSSTIRINTTTAKGYLFLNFADAFSRYLLPEEEISVTASQVNHDGGCMVTPM